MELSAAVLMRRWFEEVWNQRNGEKITTLFAPDGIAYAADESGADAHGPEAFRVFFERFMASFGTVRFTLHTVMESGNMAAGRWSAVLHHTGSGLGVAATDKQINITGMCIMRVANGQIHEGWNEWDKMALATQLGLVAPVR